MKKVLAIFLLCVHFIQCFSFNLTGSNNYNDNGKITSVKFFDEQGVLLRALNTEEFDNSPPWVNWVIGGILLVICCTQIEHEVTTDTAGKTKTRTKYSWNCKDCLAITKPVGTNSNDIIRVVPDKMQVLTENLGSFPTYDQVYSAFSQMGLNIEEIETVEITQTKD